MGHRGEGDKASGGEENCRHGRARRGEPAASAPTGSGGGEGAPASDAAVSARQPPAMRACLLPSRRICCRGGDSHCRRQAARERGGKETREMEGRETQERERESERRTRDAREIERERRERDTRDGRDKDASTGLE